jgi:ribosome recycling factor
MIRDVLQEAELRMLTAIDALESDLATFRTGRASPGLVERITVEAYGAEVSLKQVALISVPEAQQLAIRPYDPKLLGAIEKAILKSDVGITPNNDGHSIWLTMPRLTEERRRDLTRQVARRVEEAKIAIRNIRRDALSDLRNLKNQHEVAEDDFYDGQEDLQKLTDRYNDQIDEIGEQKSAEIMEV